MSVTESDTKCGVERNGLFIVLKAKVFCRKLDGISRLIGFHIDLQALCPGVVSRLYFNGDKLTVTLNDKIYFSSTLGLPIIGLISVDGKLYIHIIFSHTALKVVQFLD